MFEAYINTIEHSKQRYDTVGDYWVDGGDIVQFRVSRLAGGWREEFLIALHEMVEFALTKHEGITVAEIDAFDKAFKGDGEPGDDATAPYHKAHLLATHVEWFIAQQLGVDWEEYEKHVQEL